MHLGGTGFAEAVPRFMGQAPSFVLNNLGASPHAFLPQLDAACAQAGILPVLSCNLTEASWVDGEGRTCACCLRSVLRACMPNSAGAATGTASTAARTTSPAPSLAVHACRGPAAHRLKRRTEKRRGQRFHRLSR